MAILNPYLQFDGNAREAMETYRDVFGGQLTISTFVAAAERGTPRAELRAWILDSTAPLFAGVETRGVRFLGSITCARRV